MVRLFGRDKVHTFNTKYHYLRQTIHGKKMWIKLPHFPNLQRRLLARKLLSMDYVFYQPQSYDRAAECRKLKNLEEWDKRVKAASELPPHAKYSGRSLRIPRSKTNIPEGGAGPSVLLATPQTEIHNRKDLICDLEDLAKTTSRHLFETELEKQAEEETEEWQCRNWRKQILRDYKSLDVNEVVSNARVSALSSKDIKMTPPLTAIFMENIRYAVCTHQWRLVLKGVEGLLEEMNSMNKCWLLWNGAFLAIANIYKDDVTKIVEYATYAKDFMYCYPRRLGIEVAYWLTQKGYFTRGYHLQQEWHDGHKRLGSWDFARDKDNTKRKNIDFIASLMRAVFLYSCWKRDKLLIKHGNFAGDEFTIKQSGEQALGVFESLVELSEEIGCDTTIFIHPLIELLIEYRDIFAAKDIFKKLVLRNYGNAVFESLYQQFLETYFPFAEEEIHYYNKCQEKFTSGAHHGGRIYDQKLRFHIAQKYKRKQAVPLVLKQKPAFSW